SLLHAAGRASPLVPPRVVRVHGDLPSVDPAMGPRPAAGSDSGRVPAASVPFAPPAQRSDRPGGRPRGAGAVARRPLVRMPAGVGTMIGAAVLLLALAAAPASPATSSRPADARTGGLCTLCHPDVRVEFERSIHSNEEVTCVSCHGGDPTAADVETAH